MQNENLKLKNLKNNNYDMEMVRQMVKDKLLENTKEANVISRQKRNN